MRKRSVTVTLITLIMLMLATVAARAQPEVGLSMPRNAKSEAAAFRQSLINTVFPFTLGYGSVLLFKNNTVQTIGATMATYGLVVGPSTGNFYASDYLRGGIGALTRFGAAVLLEDAASEMFGTKFAGALNVDNRDVSLGDTKVLVGSALMVGSMAYNMITAPVSVREYNREMGYAVRMMRLKGTGETVPMLTARFNF